MFEFVFEIMEDGSISSDFIEIHETILFLNEFNKTNYRISYSKKKSLANIYLLNKENTIPIGDLEFVDTFITTQLNPDFEAKPLNIPIELIDEKYTKRKVNYLSDSELLKLNISSPTFIKSADKYKQTLGIYSNSEEALADSKSTLFLVSDYVDFISEYRIFVHNDLIVGMKHYAGDFFIYPNGYEIKDMVQNYSLSKDRPSSYTLDVGITADNKTAIIEIHPMVSVGLYGFSNTAFLIPMFIQGFKFYSTTS